MKKAKPKRQLQPFPVSISEEHAAHIKEIEECFPDINLEMGTTKRFSATELALTIAFPIGYWIATHLLDDVDQFFWETFKRGVKKLFKRFTKIEVTAEADVVFVIYADGQVRAQDKEAEFAHIKDLDDLIKHFINKKEYTWIETTLGTLVTLNYGKSLTSTVRVAGNVPVYGSSGITGWHKDALIKDKGLIIGRKGNVGSIYKSEGPFYPIDTVYYLTPRDTKCDFDFLYYLLLNLGLSEMNSDSAVPGLNRENAYSRNVTIPSTNGQKAIAAVLTSLDNKIELLQEQNKTLEALAQTLFMEWFVDFNFPNQEGKPYKKNKGGMITSELGILPEGWHLGTLGDIVDIKGGSTPSTKISEFWNGDIAWTSPKDLADSKALFLRTTSKKITQKGLSKISSGLLPLGTILLSSRAPIGYVAISAVPVAINQGYIAILPRDDYPNFFMFLWIKYHMSTIISAANGSTFLEISKASFKRIRIICPTVNVVTRFVDKVTPLFDKIQNNEDQISTLSHVRDLVLPRLMRGELRIQF